MQVHREVWNSYNRGDKRRREGRDTGEARQVIELGAHGAEETLGRARGSALQWRLHLLPTPLQVQGGQEQGLTLALS